MKNTILYILTILIIILVLIISKYNEIKNLENEVKKFNAKYEIYLDREIYGNDIASVINKAVNDNENAGVKKDEKNRYIQNDKDSVNIEIKTTDIDKTFTMEVLYNGGMEQFVKMYNGILFKSTKVEYNSENKVSYILFEQITS